VAIGTQYDSGRSLVHNCLIEYPLLLTHWRLCC